MPRPGLLHFSFRCLFVLALAVAAAAQTPTTTTLQPGTVLSLEDQMKTWPTIFDGVTSTGPYHWVNGPAYLQSHPDKAYAVTGVPFEQWVCRASYSDGTHPGKVYGNNCNIGWGGKEIVISSGFEMLVLDYGTQYAKYFTQSWQPSSSATGFKSAAAPAMRICRAVLSNGAHLGKEWAGNCNIGWGGFEVVVPPTPATFTVPTTPPTPMTTNGYSVVELGFAKSSWQNSLPQPAPQPTVVVDNLTPTTSTVNMSGGSNMTILTSQPIDFTPGKPYKLIYNRLLLLNSTNNNYLHATSYGGGSWTPNAARPKVPENPVLTWCGSTTPDVVNLDALAWFRKVNSDKPGFFFIKYLDTEICMQNGRYENTTVSLGACTGSDLQLWGTYESSGLRSYYLRESDVPPSAALTGSSTPIAKPLCVNGSMKLSICEEARTEFYFSVTSKWAYYDDKLGGSVMP